jgi:hypothetical protein
MQVQKNLFTNPPDAVSQAQCSLRLDCLGTEPSPFPPFINQHARSEAENTAVTSQTERHLRTKKRIRQQIIRFDFCIVAIILAKAATSPMLGILFLHGKGQESYF